MAKRDSTIGKSHSNLRLPPLFLRPSVVRGMIADLQGIHRAVVQVPLLPIKLVDMPRGSEDPRLAKANDNVLARELKFEPPAGEKIRSDQDGRRGDVALCQQTRTDQSEASPQPIPEVTEPAAAQVGRASPKSQSDLGRSERANDSEEGTRARPTSTKAAAKAARNQRIAAAYAAGDAIGDIAAQAGLSKARTLAIAVAAGVPPRPVGKNRLIPHLDRAAVAEAYASGLPVRTVADQFGISAETVKACVREHGGTLRPVGQRSPAYQAKAPRLAAAAPREIEHESAATDSPMGDRAGLRIQAPEGSSGEVVGGPLNDPANACEQHAKPSASGMLGPDAEAPEFKRPKPRLSQFEPPQAEPVLPELSDAAFERAVPAAKAVPDVRGMAKRLAAKRAADTKLNPARVADAFARRAAAKAAAAPVKSAPLAPAPSREECPRCGIPGWKGCAHFLPCVDQPRTVALSERAALAEAQQFVSASVPGTQRFTGKRQGIGASRL